MVIMRLAGKIHIPKPAMAVVVVVAAAVVHIRVKLIDVLTMVC